MLAEKTAPTMKKIERPMRMSMSPGNAKSSAKTRTTKMLRVRNCRFRYADAPSWTARPMVCMRVVPSGAASTSRRKTLAIASAMRAMTATTTT